MTEETVDDFAYYTGRVVVETAQEPAPKKTEIDDREAFAKAVAERVEVERTAIEAEFTRKLAALTIAATANLESASEAMVDVVTQAVATIIGEPTDPQTAMKAVRKAVEQSGQDQACTLHVPTRHYNRFKGLHVMAAADDPMKAVKLKSDDSLAETACVLSIDGKRYDVSLTSQLVAFRAALRSAAGRGLAPQGKAA